MLAGLALWTALTLIGAWAYGNLDLKARPFAETLNSLFDHPSGVHRPVGPTVADLLSFETWRGIPLVFWAVVASAIFLPRRAELRRSRWWWLVLGLAAVGIGAAVAGRTPLLPAALAAIVTTGVLPRRDPERSGLRRPLLGLLGAAGIATALMGMQLLPTLEYTRQTVRAAKQGAHDIFPFSLEPLRLAELVWPYVFGSSLSNRQWLSLLPPLHGVKFWVPSLYIGALTLVLAFAAIRGAWRSSLARLADRHRGVEPDPEPGAVRQPALVRADHSRSARRSSARSTRSTWARRVEMVNFPTGSAARTGCWRRSCRGSASSGFRASS